MSTPPSPKYQYQVGGSLEKDAPSYVVRQTDEEFYRALRSGEFCYVLNSRQMGKSSLRVQTMRRLQADGVACGVIDITSIGSHAITPAEWYLGIVRRLAKAFGTSGKTLKWWNNREGISPVQRLGEFIEEVLLVEVAQPIVVFIDEIDSVLRLEFKDDFFALIRACYNQRAEKAEYGRLTFGLLGVATPSDLIQDKSRTPFNIGRAIELQGFQLAEAEPLVPGLEQKADHPQAVLRAVLTWTGGQPFLTQKLCQLIVESPFQIAAGSEAELVEQLVRSRIITNWEAQDEPQHLRTIRDRLLSNEQRSGRLLGLYQQILQQDGVAANDSPDQMELRLAGLVVRRAGRLSSYNHIYLEVFNSEWLEQGLARLRPYTKALDAWVSNHHEESWLLRGQALQSAQVWARDKSLSTLDYQFLAASQEAEQQAVESALVVERQQREIEQQARQKAEEANQVLTEAKQKAQRRLRFSSVVSVGILVAGIAAGMVATKSVTEARQKAADVEQKADQRVKEADRELALTQQDATTIRQRAEERQREANQQVMIANAKLVQTEREVAQKVEAANQRLAVAQEQTTQAQQEQTRAQQAQKQAEQETAKQKIQLEQQSKIAFAQKVISKAEAMRRRGKSQLQLSMLLAVEAGLVKNASG
ncbi:AAA-like domain-containing protein [Leptolyngbya sp. FACHB-36]|uniref:AAA-like domain-containing protein n=1 Tax=Leptolyngbya sp. FACHB-36 TaxID=2692808 RepID=UPI001681AB90|nr:AAA-like domain-containing protein [Leptolyngbya sp. FACHB-36]MBD2020642.1 AAA-like domain-containing protein [Leptolyngbya sp. FACHB-36]